MVFILHLIVFSIFAQIILTINFSQTTQTTSVMHKAYEIAINKGGTTLEGLLKSKSITLPEFLDETSEIWRQVSKEYAEKASGEVKVILGKNVNSAGVWNQVELPALKNNPNVTKIIAIDPETFIETIITK